MAFNYQAIKDGTVIPLIAEFGDDIILRTRAIESGAEPWDPTYNPPVDFPGKAVRTRFKQDQIDGRLIQRDDVLYLVSPGNALPDPELVDKLVDGGAVFNVINIDPLQPGPTTMLWKVQCRK